MSHIAFIADVHVGNPKKLGGEVRASMNRRCREILTALVHAVNMAGEFGCDTLTVLGDLFDTTKPLPQMICMVQRAFEQAVELDVEPWVLVGNHDFVGTDENDHALGALHPVARVAERPTTANLEGYSLLLVPYQPGKAEEWLPVELAKLLANDRPFNTKLILCLHLGIYDEQTRPHWAEDPMDAVSVELVKQLIDEHELSAVFAGNWHNRQTWQHNDVPIVQCGSLAPTGWNDAGLEGHGLTVLDTETGFVTFVEILGPRFLELPTGVKLGGGTPLPDSWVAAHKAGHALYIRGTTDDRRDIAELRERIQLALPGAITEITPDNTVAAANARTAVVVARSADTLDEALEGFVRSMPLEDDIDRGVIIQRCLRYLRA